jgi:ketosteroid isomerase-like protein
VKKAIGYKCKRKDAMKLVTYSIIGMALSILGIGSALSQTDDSDSSLQSFLPQFDAGINGFINGDPTLWKKNASHRDDVTIMGGWGGLAKGWTKVDPWYDWAAARFKESGAKVNIEYISSEVSGNLAYTATIERSEALVVGQDKPASMSLRVTHVFRKEDGVWKLIHRHADPLIDRTAPAAVLQK